jgi:hypothetical protein
MKLFLLYIAVIPMLIAFPAAFAEEDAVYLSDIFDHLPVQHDQGWGRLGLDTATVPPEGRPIVLTGEAEGHYTKSYNILAKRVPFSARGGLEENGEPLTRPDRFGARASALMDMLLAGHEDVALDAYAVERLATWMDANAQFYGTFDYEDQARQQRGEHISGPALE